MLVTSSNPITLTLHTPDALHECLRKKVLLMLHSVSGNMMNGVAVK